jgi:ABC-type glutathione transport system ATPase component
MEPWERARLGLFVLQSRNNSFSNLTVRESLRLTGIGSCPTDLEPFFNRNVSDLSGGERQKLGLAGADGRKSVGIYDEPFSALDSSTLASNGLKKCLLTCSAALVAVPQPPEPV